MAGDDAIDADTVESDYPEHLKQLIARADAAGIGYEVAVRGTGKSARHWLTLTFPAGAETRSLRLTPWSIKRLVDTPFEKFIFVGKYAAVLNIETGDIEASLTPERGGTRLRDLPGVEFDDAELGASDRSADGAWSISTSNLDAEWKLLVKDPDSALELELGSVSESVSILLPGDTSLRIRGASSSSNSEAEAVLSELADKFLFEIDLIHGVSVQLMTSRVRHVDANQPNVGAVLKFPKNNYADASLRLYHYGRRASDLPLLEFLGYYQAVEHFFPYFAREDTVHQIRSTLLNPKFDPSNDAQIGRLIGIAAPARAVISELEQLKTTLLRSVTAGDLEDFVRSDGVRFDSLTKGGGILRGVSALRFGKGHPDIREQVAERVYTIRCRIVHSKDESSGYDEVLLPLSKEAEALRPDIEVLRFLAQSSMVARAARA